MPIQNCLNKGFTLTGVESVCAKGVSGCLLEVLPKKLPSVEVAFRPPPSSQNKLLLCTMQGS